jgi:hypothetical protein
MDTTKIQTSFIPQKPFASPTPSSGNSKGIIYTLSVIIFSISVVASIGVFAYEKILNGQISNMEKSLSDARTTLEPTIIRQLARTEDKFASAKEIIDKHDTVSAFFDFLSKLTLPSLRFSSLNYQSGPAGIVVSMSGEAKSYAIVALQAKIFADEPLIKNAQFSDFGLNDVGNVLFQFKATLDPKVVSYKSIIDALNTPTPPVEVPVASEPSSTGTGTSTDTLPNKTTP